MSSAKLSGQGESPEQVAFKLTMLIAEAEGRESYPHADKPMTREYILKTFAQCLYTIHNPAFVEDGLKLGGSV